MTAEPVATEKPAELPVLAPASEPAAPTPAATPAATVAESWVPLPNLGKGRSLEAVERPLPGEKLNESAPAPASVATAHPAPENSDDGGGLVEPVPHVVQRGENFWTISRLYYGSGRYYKALWAANRGNVPVIDKLYVGQTIRIPAPEALDRSLIDPVRPAAGATAQTAPSATLRKVALRPAATTASTGRPGSLEVELPTRDPFARRSPDDRDGPDPDAHAAPRPKPQYRVHRNETLRSIARDVLGDSHRADEILQLNSNVVDDPRNLTPGQILELPEDAQIGRVR